MAFAQEEYFSAASNCQHANATDLQLRQPEEPEYFRSKHENSNFQCGPLSNTIQTTPVRRGRASLQQPSSEGFASFPTQPTRTYLLGPSQPRHMIRPPIERSLKDLGGAKLAEFSAFLSMFFAKPAGLSATSRFSTATHRRCFEFAPPRRRLTCLSWTPSPMPSTLAGVPPAGS